MRVVMVDNYDSFTWNLVHGFQVLGAGVTVVMNDRVGPGEVLDLHPNLVVLSPGPGEPSGAGRLMEILAGLVERRVPVFGVCLGMQAIGQCFGVPVVRAPQPVHGKASAVWHDGLGLFEGLPNPMRCGRYHSLCLDGAGVEGSGGASGVLKRENPSGAVVGGSVLGQKIGASGLIVSAWCEDAVLPHDGFASNAGDWRVRMETGSAKGDGEDAKCQDPEASLPAPAFGPSKIIMAVRHERLPIFGVQFHPESVLTAAGQLVLERSRHIRPKSV